MTVSYQSDVASSTSGGLIRLLWRWRGSVWKLVYRELLLFVAVFLGLSLAYRFLFTERLKRNFEYLVIFCSAFVDMIPLSFILGFYVSFTATRWWNQYTAIPWPDKLMNNIAMYIPGSDDTSRMLRRTLMRYLNLTLVLVLRSISIAVKRRFPTKEHLVEAGFMTKLELELHTSVPSNEFNTFWIPCTWFINLLREARQECRITDSSGLKLIMEEFNEFRSKCGLLWSYDWVSIPLVYTQVVTIATYAFFTASVFGRQAIERNPKVFNVDIEHRYEPYIPVFTILQFLLYMGLLKLGEQLINPFGDDDEDFELNWIIDRHLKVSFLGVDTLNTSPPPMTKDCYWDDTDIKLPYTAAAVSYKKRTYRGSMAAYHVPSEQQGLVVPEFEEDDQDYEVISDTLSKKDKSSSSIFGSVFGASKLVKRNESLLTLGSEDFEANYPEVWRGSSASFFVTGDGDYDDGESLKAGSGKRIHLGNSGDSESKNDNGLSDHSFQGIRGEPIYFAGAQRKRSDQISVTMLSTGSADDHQPVDSLLLTAGHTPRPDFSFDPTLGVFSSKFSTSSSRRPSASSLFKQVKETKGQVGRPPLPDLSPLLPRLDAATVSRSSSSASRKTIKSTCRSGLLKGFGKGDSGLKIRPFVKSKVTFSDDTKSEFDRKEVIDAASLFHLDPSSFGRDRLSSVDLTLSTPELCQSELLSSRDKQTIALPGSIIGRRASASIPPTKAERATLVDTSQPVTIQPLIITSVGGETSGQQQLQHEQTKARRISCEDVANNGNVSPDSIHPGQVWLRHQSLPNIQEIAEESPTSPGPEPGGREFGLIRSSSRRNKDLTGERVLGKMLSRQSEIEEDIGLDTGQSGLLISPEDSTADGSNSDVQQTSPSSSGRVIARRAKKRSIHLTNSSNSKQSSTDSESGSYATACSIFSPISEEEASRAANVNKLSFHSTDSSLSSFSSAKDQDGGEPEGVDGSATLTRTALSEHFGDVNYSSDSQLPKIIVLPTSPAESQLDILHADDGES